MPACHARSTCTTRAFEVCLRSSVVCPHPFIPSLEQIIDQRLYVHTHIISRVEMAMAARNPITRWVLPDKGAGVEGYLYPWVR
jgi:hypothetical protein